jgi:glycosyltransferase involved in cell wall biosynthesis
LPSVTCIRSRVSGRGDLADQLAARAQGLGLVGRVHLLGLRSDIGAILGAADLFVLPSLSEGLPLALLEAMFAGCPIIASDVGEVAATLGHGDSGIVVPPGNAAALASAIDGLLANPARATELGRRALARAQAEYHVSQMVRRYVDVYRQSLSSCGSGVPGLHTRLEEL